MKDSRMPSRFTRIAAEYEAGMASYERGKYKEAQRLLEESLRAFDEEAEAGAVGVEGEEELYSAILLGIGACQQQLKEHAAAVSTYEACVEVLMSSPREQCLMSPLINLGLLHYRQGDTASALSKYKRAQKIAEGTYCTDRMTCADLYHNIAVVYDGTSQLQKALTYYAKSLRVREKAEATTEQQLLLALTKENVAMVWRDQDNQTEAIKLMQTVLPVRKKFNGVRSLEYAGSLFNMGLLHFDVGRPHAALSYFKPCLEVRREVLGEDSQHTKLAAKYVEVLHRKLVDVDSRQPGRIAEGSPTTFGGGMRRGRSPSPSSSGVPPSSRRSRSASLGGSCTSHHFRSPSSSTSSYAPQPKQRLHKQQSGGSYTSRYAGAW